ncbi:hydroxyproline-rich glycoprotein family protein [Raphanus sativus]|uniref:Uncharacterized protein LOC130510203 n=1 Tax=Raphanus sativus TaxID=3726 RepID=A0A9W3DFI7_RAPSA|nr:uncharacterized protein LOC130510203 [Raphanus sativus]KAJ4907841.1 hydroxyproline-rich glycoprotein family protein [Raphanus sativus]
MILKQLKQLTLSATRRNNAHILRLPRLYSSPATVSQTLPASTSKPSKRLSRDDRRLVVESFVSKYRAANAGKFPSLKATVREVGGGYYIVRDILQELKLRPNAPPVSQVPDEASSMKQDHTIESSHPSSDEVSLQGDNSLVESSLPSSDEVSPQEDNSLIASSHPSFDEVSLHGDSSLIESSRSISDEVSLQGDISLVIPATHDRSETVTASLDKDVDCKCDGSSSTHFPEIQTLKVPEECLKTEEEEILTHLSSQEPKPDCYEGGAASLDKDIDSKCDGSSTHFPEIQTLKVSEECLKKPEIEEEETLTQIPSQEPRADHIEGRAASANVFPTETRQVPEKGDAEVKTGENSSAWSNIVSFAKEFVSFWRKG